MTKSPLEQVDEVRNWPGDKHWPDDVVKPLAVTIEALTAERDALRNNIANLSVWAQKAHPDQQLVDLAHVLAILDTLNNSTPRDETAV